MEQYIVIIKPLTVNQAWQGKRFKSHNYQIYEKELFYLLPKKIKIPKDLLEVHYIFGTSSKNSDYDNFIKIFQDILQKKYGFDDKKIYKAIIEKIDVKKGKEFISFGFQKYLYGKN